MYSHFWVVRWADDRKGLARIIPGIIPQGLVTSNFRLCV